MLRWKNALASTCCTTQVTTLGMLAAGGVLHANVSAALVEDMCVEIVQVFASNIPKCFIAKFYQK